MKGIIMKSPPHTIRSAWLTALLLALLIFAPLPGHAAESGASGKAPPTNSVLLQSAGKKIVIDENYYFVYEFDKKPALGSLVLKIQLFSNNGERSTALSLKGSSDMPSMRGAHYMGDQPFRVSKRGDYLLPIDVVMPGDWEVQVIILSGEKVIYRGHILFDV